MGQLARHISLGRLTWFVRMDAPGSAAPASRIPRWQQDSDSNRDIVEESFAITDLTAELVTWLEQTW